MMMMMMIMCNVSHILTQSIFSHYILPLFRVEWSKATSVTCTGLLIEGLKRRGSAYHCDGRKVWEQSVKDAKDVVEVRHLLFFCYHLLVVCC